MTVSPPLDLTDLKKVFANVVEEIQGECEYEINHVTTLILTGNKNTWRSGDYIGLYLVSVVHESTQKVAYGVAGRGRGGGLLGFTFGVIKTLEGKISSGIRRAAEQNNSAVTEDPH